ncbi:class F sortase, partial [Candidatus Saccharibacteria bacterium]|nr:class F sortase [Candidatus Saccharibacteria bacterium]
DTPRYLDIERLKIHARIQISEVNTNGLLATPNNIYDASWYSGSSKPGHNGYIIISVIHSNGSNKGIFANLDSLEKGDIIKIENGAGDTYQYKVEEINVISDQNDSDDVLAKMQTRLNQAETLSLVTVKTNSSNQEFESLVMLRATKKD